MGVRGREFVGLCRDGCVINGASAWEVLDVVRDAP